MAEDQIREVFRVCDKDGDGIVSLQDMQRVMQEFGRNVPVSELEMALQRLDANGDGKVDWEDFRISLMSGVSWMPTAGTPKSSTPKSSTPKGKPVNAAKAAVGARARAKSTLGASGKRVVQEDTGAATHGECPAMKTLLGSLKEAQTLLDESALESDGEDVASLQGKVSEYREWLSSLHSQATQAVGAYEAYREEAEQRLQSRNRRLADAMAAAADATAAKKAAEAERNKVAEEYKQARTVLNRASDAEVDREMLLEQHEALKHSLQTAVSATSMAEDRCRELEAEAETLRDEVSRIEDSTTAARDTAEQKEEVIAGLHAQLEEAARQTEELEQALTLRGGELLAMTEERNRYQRQLEETQELLAGQREMMDMVRENIEAQQGGGGWSEGAGGSGGGLDLAAETQAAEMDSILGQLSVLSEQLAHQSEGNQGALQEMMHSSMQDTMRTSMEDMQSSMSAKMEAQMEAMQAKMEAAMQAQLETQMAKNMEVVMSPLKERESEAQREKQREIQALQREHELSTLTQKLAAEKEVAVAELSSRLAQSEVEFKAQIAQRETAAAMASTEMKEQLEAAKRAAQEADAALAAAGARRQQEEESHKEEVTRLQAALTEGSQESGVAAVVTAQTEAELSKARAAIQEAQKGQATAREELARAQATVQSLEEAQTAKEARHEEMEALKAKQLEMEREVERVQAEKELELLRAQLSSASEQLTTEKQRTQEVNERSVAEGHSLKAEIEELRGRLSAAEEKNAAVEAKLGAVEESNQENNLASEKARVQWEAKDAASQDELTRLRAALAGKEGEAADAIRRSQEAIEKRREEEKEEERQGRRQVQGLQEELAAAKAAGAAAQARVETMQKELNRLHEAQEEKQSKEDIVVTSVLARTKSMENSVESGVTMLQFGDQDAEEAQAATEAAAEELLELDGAPSERMRKMSARLRGSVEELSQCLKMIDQALCHHFVERPEQALQNIQKELRVANCTRQTTMICIEELFGAGAVTRSKGGLLGGLLASSAQAVSKANERVEDSEQQAAFLKEENQQVLEQVRSAKVEKEKALQACEEEWRRLNVRLQARKATTDLIARKLQEELVSITVNFKMQTVLDAGFSITGLQDNAELDAMDEISEDEAELEDMADSDVVTTEDGQAAV